MLPGRTDNDVKNRWHSCVRNRNKENFISPMPSTSSPTQKSHYIAKNSSVSTTIPKMTGVKRKAMNVVSFDEDYRKDINYAHKNYYARIRSPLKEVRKQGVVDKAKGQKSLVHDYSSSSIILDISMLDKNYGHLLSPIRKDDCRSLAKEVHDLKTRLSTQKEGGKNKCTNVFNKNAIQDVHKVTDFKIKVSPVELIPSPLQNRFPDDLNGNFQNHDSLGCEKIPFLE